MADPLYTRLYATADRLLSKYGKAAQIETDGAPTGPPHNPQPGAPTVSPCVYVESKNEISERPSTVIQVGDVFGYMAPSAQVPPTLARRLLVGPERLNFVTIEPLDPGGLNLLWMFQARR